MKVETKPSIQILLCVLVFLLGGGLLVYSIKYTKDYNYKQSTYKDISGIVTNTDTKEENGTETTDITVEYEVDGKVYHAYTTLSSYEVYVEGSTINFKYNPDNPEDVIWKHDAKAKILFPIVAIVFMIAGIIGIIRSSKMLMAEGNNISNVDHNNFEKVNSMITPVENTYQPMDNMSVINSQKEEVKPVEETKPTALEDIYKK